jgi:hypothetical protein
MGITGIVTIITTIIIIIDRRNKLSSQLLDTSRSIGQFVCMLPTGGEIKGPLWASAEL